MLWYSLISSFSFPFSLILTLRFLFSTLIFFLLSLCNFFVFKFPFLFSSFLFHASPSSLLLYSVLYVLLIHAIKKQEHQEATITRVNDSFIILYAHLLLEVSRVSTAVVCAIMLYCLRLSSYITVACGCWVLGSRCWCWSSGCHDPSTSSTFPSPQSSTPWTPLPNPPLNTSTSQLSPIPPPLPSLPLTLSPSRTSIQPILLSFVSNWKSIVMVATE